MDQDGLIDAIMVSLNFGSDGEVERAVVAMPGSREPPTQGVGPVPALEVEEGIREQSTLDEISTEQVDSDVVVEEGLEASWVDGVE